LDFDCNLADRQWRMMRGEVIPARISLDATDMNNWADAAITSRRGGTEWSMNETMKRTRRRKFDEIGNRMTGWHQEDARRFGHCVMQEGGTIV
jgi:hypothetical protein